MDGKRPRSQCIKCEAEASKLRRKEHPDKVKAIKKRYTAAHPEMIRKCGRRAGWRKMGLDPDIVEAYLASHNGKCDICGNPPNGRVLAIDHCHKAGHFRGVLCSTCNCGLGYFKDNPELFDKAKLYLIRPKAIPAV